MNFGGGPGSAFDIDDPVDEEDTSFNAVYDSESESHYNVIDQNYVDYINNIDDAYVSSVQYTYGVQFLMLSDINNELLTSASEGVYFRELSNNEAYLNGQFNVVSGTLPTDETGVVVIVDIYNKIDSNIMEFLGLDPNADIDFDDVVGKEIVVANPDDITYVVEGMEVVQEVNQTTYDNGTTLTITGVLRADPDGLETSTSGIFYHDDLELSYIEENQDSTTCTVLMGIDTSSMNPDEINSLKLQQHTSGCLETPLMISIYPESFETKDEIVNYLDAYNQDLVDDDQVLYTDLAELITGIMSSVINSISVVLIAFAAISLVVSSIMIGIITYISVLERTKEIGILRSLGARKKDISRVFNAESFIVGLLAGVIGILITVILSIPLNMILEGLLDGFSNIVNLRVDHGIYLILISVALTFIAGLIPSRMAAKKDPVEALRHNE